MEMKALRFELIDAVTVRDGRPFEVGVGHHARDLWPPSPWTFLGATRALAVETLGVPAASYGGEDPAGAARAIEVLGPPDLPPKFSLCPVLLINERNEVFYPLPADILTYGGGGEDIRLGRLGVHSADWFTKKGYSFSGAARPSLMLPPVGYGHPKKASRSLLLNKNGLHAWLDGGVPEAKDVMEASEGVASPVFSDWRIGIALDPQTGSVREGYFYGRAVHLLAPGWSLLLPLLEDGTEGGIVSTLRGSVRLGSDGHLARVSPDTFNAPECSLVEQARRAVLFFPGPVGADSLEESNLSRVAGGSVRLEAVAAERPISIGGWLLHRKSFGPRPMRQYYPAGAVVYISSQGGDLRKFHCRSIAADRWERAAGFGFCFAGVCKASKEGKDEQREC